VIPDNDDDTNLVAPITDVDEVKEFDANIQDDDNEEQTDAHPRPTTNKTLCAMWQLAMFYNPA